MVINLVVCCRPWVSGLWLTLLVIRVRNLRALDETPKLVGATLLDPSCVKARLPSVMLSLAPIRLGPPLVSGQRVVLTCVVFEDGVVIPLKAIRLPLLRPPTILVTTR